jgi:hypothetical protein
MLDTSQSTSGARLAAGSRDPERMADLIEQKVKEVFGDNKLDRILANNSWKQVTRTIEQTFGDLGQKLGYQVATSGFPGRFDQAWVYNLIWFVPGHGKFDVVMAMESEHFSKLLDSTADVRVWLSCDPSPEAAQEYIANYLAQATRFKKMIRGTVFIFIMFEWKTRTTIVKRSTIR